MAQSYGRSRKTALQRKVETALDRVGEAHSRACKAFAPLHPESARLSETCRVFEGIRSAMIFALSALTKEKIAAEELTQVTGLVDIQDRSARPRDAGEAEGNRRAKLGVVDRDPGLALQNARRRQAEAKEDRDKSAQEWCHAIRDVEKAHSELLKVKVKTFGPGRDGRQVDLKEFSQDALCILKKKSTNDVIQALALLSSVCTNLAELRGKYDAAELPSIAKGLRYVESLKNQKSFTEKDIDKLGKAESLANAIVQEVKAFQKSIPDLGPRVEATIDKMHRLN